jgi:hypothetical protein
MSGPRSATQAMKELTANALNITQVGPRPFTRTVGRLIDRHGVYPNLAGFRYGMLGIMPELPPHA